MPRIPQAKIDEIRQSVDIVDVMGQYLSLTKKGRNYVAICPFHEDTHPSLSISENKQIYMCFVCHNGGNVFTFLQNYLHISYIEAVGKVAEMGHVDMSGYDLTKRVAPIDNKLKPYYDMHEEAQKIYTYYLNTQVGIAAKDYLHDRGFDEEIIKTFGIGYAPAKNILFDAFTKLGYDTIAMENSGLVIESHKHYDRFSDRIIFPLWDEQGRVVGFSGRIYRLNQDGAKYMNSPESEIFIKGQTLYNYHNALRPAREAGFVYINEGFMDVIAMHRAKHDNCIALMGTALTSGHVRMLKRMTKKIVLCLDGDAAGQNAAMKSCDFLVKNGFEVRIILLPDGHDPDEIFKTDGKDGLDRLLRDELTPFDFLMLFESGRLDLRNYDDRSKLFDRGVEVISQMTDDKQIDDCVTKLSNLTQFSREIILNHLQNKQIEKPQEYAPVVRQIEETRMLVDKYIQAERNLLFYMLNDKEVAEQYRAKAGFMYNDVYRVVASYIVDYYRKNNVMDEANLIDRILSDRISEQKKNILVQAIVEISNIQLPLPASNQQDAIRDYIKTIGENAIELKKKQLLDQFQHVLDPKQQAAILQEINELKKETM